MAISVESLERIYSVKKGADVRALKGITFNLPDTGMVFILVNRVAVSQRC